MSLVSLVCSSSETTSVYSFPLSPSFSSPPSYIVFIMWNHICWFNSSISISFCCFLAIRCIDDASTQKKLWTINWGLCATYSAISTSHLVLCSSIAAIDRSTGWITAYSMSEMPCNCVITSLRYQSSKLHFRSFLAGLFTAISNGYSKTVVFGGSRDTLMLCSSTGEWLEQSPVP